MYKINNPYTIIRVNDTAVIPLDPSNIDYKEYLQWVSEGNIPEPADLFNPNTVIQSQIDTLESSIKIPRITREFMLENLESRAIQMGSEMDPPLDAEASLAYLYASMKGYQKLKDLDNQITALRDQLI